MQRAAAGKPRRSRPCSAAPGHLPARTRPCSAPAAPAVRRALSAGALRARPASAVGPSRGVQSLASAPAAVGFEGFYQAAKHRVVQKRLDFRTELLAEERLAWQQQLQRQQHWNQSLCSSGFGFEAPSRAKPLTGVGASQQLQPTVDRDPGEYLARRATLLRGAKPFLKSPSLSGCLDEDVLMELSLAEQRWMKSSLKRLSISSEERRNSIKPSSLRSMQQQAWHLPMQQPVAEGRHERGKVPTDPEDYMDYMEPKDVMTVTNVAENPVSLEAEDSVRDFGAKLEECHPFGPKENWKPKTERFVVVMQRGQDLKTGQPTPAQDPGMVMRKCQEDLAAWKEHALNPAPEPKEDPSHDNAQRQSIKLHLDYGGNRLELFTLRVWRSPP